MIEEDREYRVMRRVRDRADAEWKLVVTSRGNGRPFRSRVAAKGLVTRELNSHWNRNYEYKIQWRPVTSEWSDV